MKKYIDFNYFKNKPDFHTAKAKLNGEEFTLRYEIYDTTQEIKVYKERIVVAWFPSLLTDLGRKFFEKMHFEFVEEK